ncbi:MAG TPA: O-antigen ligase family protein [Solirubrobacteraceae bacterium]|jgi:hypothetical protein|nr:O-antigen ligase family protein [Solirubrobacteraceae bacterium]
MATSEEGRPEQARPAVVNDVSRTLLALVPGGLLVYFGFLAGGFFVGPTAGAGLFLLLFLAARILFVSLPGAGLNRNVAIAAGALGLFALWTLVSSHWSHASARSLVEFDRAMMYTAALLLFGTVRMSARRLRWMVRGLALAIVVVCGAGLITRLAPDVWPLAQRSASPRLSYPITYWNAFAAVAAFGIILCFGLSSTEREPRVVRVLSAAAIPLLASALLLTVSRGGVGTAMLGVLVFIVVGHPRGMFSALIAVVPTTTIAMMSTYGADLLLTKDPATLLTHAAQVQGHHVAAVVALCAVVAAVLRALLLYLDDVLVQLRPTKALRRQVLTTGAIALAVAVVGASVAVDLPGQVDQFLSPAKTQAEAKSSDKSPNEDLRTRLTNITDNGRIAFWTVSMKGFKAHPLNGTGAGTFENQWDEHRSISENVIDAHGLYPEVLGELGIVGLALVLVAILTLLVGVARRARGPYRGLFATIFAVMCAWTFAAGFDWHWEMPVVTMWFFALGGAAVARPRQRSAPIRFLGLLPRVVMAVAVLALVALVPLRLALSQNRLKSTSEFYALGYCTEADMFAKQSLEALKNRPEPYEFRAGCAMRDGKLRDAIIDMKEAVKRDPNNWQVHFSLAAVQGLDGRDARLEAERAYHLNPRNDLLQHTVKAFAAGNSAGEWKAAARKLNLQVLPPKV